MSKAHATTSGDVWSFPIRGTNETGLLRVVLAIADLGLPSGHPLGFARGCRLVQISKDKRLAKGSFSPENMFANGLFLGNAELWQRSGFVRVDARPVSPEEIEFPTWFGDGDRLFICRGQLKQGLIRKDFGDLVKKWAARLTLFFPERLSHQVFEGGNRSSRRRLERSDVRYSPHRDEIIRLVQFSFGEPYCEAVANVRGALTKIKNAIAARPGR